MFCIGETMRRAAPRNSSQFCASPRRPKPSADVSAPSSAVACSARTWPWGVRSSVRRMMSSITGAMPRLAHAHGDRLAPAHVDRLLAHGERARPVGRDVAVGIGRIDALDEQVLAVEVGGGEAPADRAVVAQHDGRRAGRGGAADVEARPDQPRQVPGAGKAERRDADRWRAGACPTPNGRPTAPIRSRPRACAWRCCRSRDRAGRGRCASAPRWPSSAWRPDCRPTGSIRNFTVSVPILRASRSRSSSARQLPSRPSAISLAHTSKSAGRHGSGL